MAFSPDGKTIVSGSSDSTIKVWDANPRLFDASEWEEVDIISHPYPTITVHLFPLNKELGYLRSNYWRNKVTRGLRKEYSTAGARLDPRTAQSHGMQVRQCRLVPPRAKLTPTNPPSTASLELKATKENAHNGYVMSVGYNSDGDKIVSGGQDGTLKVWDAGVSTDTPQPLAHT